MIKTIEVAGKTEDEAIAAALAQLGKERDEVSVEILERAKAGFLGIGSCNALVRVSYEQIESKAEQIETFLQGLFEHMGIEAKMTVAENDNGGYDVTVEGPNMGALIGRRGETLDAVQHLVNYTINRGDGERVRINLDTENYRAKRTEALEKLAEKVAAKVVKYRKNMMLEPMNAYERHVIHTALQDFDGVTTYSKGSEPNRRVVIAYEGKTQPTPQYTSREWS